MVKAQFSGSSNCELFSIVLRFRLQNKYYLILWSTVARLVEGDYHLKLNNFQNLPITYYFKKHVEAVTVDIYQKDMLAGGQNYVLIHLCHLIYHVWNF